MAFHTISMTMPPRVVLNSDVDFDVHSGESKLGTLRISKGTVEWVPANFVRGYHLEWEKFDQVMRENGSH
jgi:hypothetical protein